MRQGEEPDSKKKRALIVIRTGNVLKPGEKDPASGEQVVLPELSHVQCIGSKSRCSLPSLRFPSPGRLAGAAVARYTVHGVFAGPSGEKSQFSSAFIVDC